MYTFGSMITGFNHNVKYRDRVFHVQTEDNGEKTPLIFTHLFDGGDILATKKIDYKMIVGKPDFEKQVRRMMEDQHKAVLKALMHGEYDGLIDAHDAAARTTDQGAAPAPVPAEAAPPPRARARSAERKAAVAASTTADGATGAPPAGPATSASKGAPVQETPAAAAAPKPPPPGGAKREPRKGVTIFGESLISEKTLDEVILKYLIDQGSEKK